MWCNHCEIDASEHEVSFVALKTRYRLELCSACYWYFSLTSLEQVTMEVEFHRRITCAVIEPRVTE